MADHPNVAKIREGYDAFAKADLEAVGKLWDPGIVWHVGGRSPVAGDYKGQEEIFGFFGKLFELTAGTLKIEVHDILANDEHGVALVNLTAQRGEKSLDMNEVHVFHLTDGQVTEFWGFEEDQYRGDTFYA